LHPTREKQLATQIYIPIPGTSVACQMPRSKTTRTLIGGNRQPSHLTKGRGAADRGERGKAAGANAPLIGVMATRLGQSLSTGERARLMTTIRNRHPADELADVRTQLQQLKQREAELQTLLLSGECGLAGDNYVAVISQHSMEELDLKALREHYGTALNPFVVDRQTNFIRLWPKPLSMR
jgi:hypothetical protein